MEKFEAYRPKSLLELSDTEVAELSPDDQHELAELVLLESRETMESLSAEIDEMDEKIFSLDSFYEIQKVIEEYKMLMNDLGITDEDFKKHLQFLFEKIERKNPISEVAKQNRGNVLLHSASTEEITSLFETRYEHAEICTTVGTLKKRSDIFQPKRRKQIDASLIINPSNAFRWFSKDVGSGQKKKQGIRRGRRELRGKSGLKYEVVSMEEALNHQNGPRVEAWVDIKKTPIVALLILNPEKSEDLIELAGDNNFPVLFNSHLYE